MTMYRITWEIDLEAPSAYLAAMEALAIQRDPRSIATVFSVKDSSDRHAPAVVIDLEPAEISA